MADEVSNFWGPVTSKHEWCEPNYVHTSYVAEFFNTISNVPCIILALIGLGNALRQRFEKRFSVLHISNIILAIGSMLYHASLQQLQFLSLTSLPMIRTEANTAIISRKRPVIDDPLEFFFRQQQGDETPMVWEMLLYIYILYSPDWHYRSTMPTFLFLYGAAFAITHSLLHFDVAFKLHYALLCLLCIPRMYKYYIHTEDVSAKWLAKLYVATLLFGSLCWLVDRLFCKEIARWYFNPQGHALWHVFMGFNSYFANTFLMYCRAQQREWNPKVKHVFGLLPYVKIQKSKSQ